MTEERRVEEALDLQGVSAKERVGLGEGDERRLDLPHDRRHVLVGKELEVHPHPCLQGNVALVVAMATATGWLYGVFAGEVGEQTSPIPPVPSGPSISYGPSQPLGHEG